MILRAVVRGSILGACLMAGTASAVEVKLSTAWMRPVAAGAASAMAYVDMQSDAAVELIGASTPVAQSVAIVVVGSDGGKDATGLQAGAPDPAINPMPGSSPGASPTGQGAPVSARIVPTLALPANTMVRLAYRGNHLRLVGIQKAISNGDAVPLTLRFKTASGEVVQRQIDIEVRGLVSPPVDNGKGVGMAAPPMTDGPRLPVPPPTK